MTEPLAGRTEEEDCPLPQGEQSALRPEELILHLLLWENLGAGEDFHRTLSRLVHRDIIPILITTVINATKENGGFQEGLPGENGV